METPADAARAPLNGKPEYRTSDEGAARDLCGFAKCHTQAAHAWRDASIISGHERNKLLEHPRRARAATQMEFSPKSSGGRSVPVLHLAVAADDAVYTFNGVRGLAEFACDELITSSKSL
jgi:hypothetical protein